MVTAKKVAPAKKGDSLFVKYDGYEVVEAIRHLVDMISDKDQCIHGGKYSIHMQTRVSGKEGSVPTLKFQISDKETGWQFDYDEISYADKVGLCALYARLVAYASDSKLQMLQGMVRKAKQDLELIHEQIQEAMHLHEGKKIDVEQILF